MSLELIQQDVAALPATKGELDFRMPFFRMPLTAPDEVHIWERV